MIKILYVEDNAALRETIVSLLESPDRELVVCANAEQALKMLPGTRFDVLMTDVSLPGMSGTALARMLLAADPNQWVVLCSGYEFRDGLDTLGPNVRSLPKPFELDELDALMDEITRALRPPPAPR